MNIITPFAKKVLFCIVFLVVQLSLSFSHAQTSSFSSSLYTDVDINSQNNAKAEVKGKILGTNTTVTTLGQISTVTATYDAEAYAVYNGWTETSVFTHQFKIMVNGKVIFDSGSQQKCFKCDSEPYHRITKNDGHFAKLSHTFLVVSGSNITFWARSEAITCPVDNPGPTQAMVTITETDALIDWFEASQPTKPLEKPVISGPSTRGTLEYGNWVAMVSGGAEPYLYEWEFKDQWSNWHPIGSSTNTLSTLNDVDFDLRVKVIDGNGTAKLSNTFHVSVTGFER